MINLAPEIREIDGKIEYFYTIGQLDYIKHRNRMRDIVSRMRNATHPLATNPGGLSRHTAVRHTHAV